MKVGYVIALCLAVAIVAAVAATLRTRSKDIKKVAYMMDALEDGELNFRFQDKNKYNTPKYRFVVRFVSFCLRVPFCWF